MANKITCTCGHSWNKSDSSKKDMRVCHVCGKDNTMKNGGWLDKFDAPQAQNGIEGTMGGLTDKGFNFNPAWGGAWRDGGDLPKSQKGKNVCPPGFVNIEGKCFDRGSEEYKALYKYGIGYLDNTGTLVSSRTELPEVVIKPKPVLDFLDSDLKDLGGPAEERTRYAFDQLGKKYGFIPNIKILKENQPSALEQTFFEFFDPSRTSRNLGETPHYNPFSKTAFIDTLDDYIAELSHHVDPFITDPSRVVLHDLPALLTLKDAYKTEGTSEYIAHEEIEPKLIKEFKNYQSDYWDKMYKPQYYTSAEGRKERMSNIWSGYTPSIEKKQDGGWLEKYADDAQNGDEVTYTHNPSGSREAYMLKRTVTPYTSKRDIRKKTQTPTDPRQVNFLSNYAGAIGEPGSEGFVYPTSVPFEGKKHWNIDRFIIDPQFGTSYPDLNNQASTRQQMRNNVLADMYKYNMLQNPDKRGKAWRQAKRFVRTEIDPRTSGAYYEEAVRSKLPFAAGSITDAVNESYMRGFGVAQSSAQSPDVSDDDYYTRDFKNKPITESRAKEVATDWLRNYKGLSKKQAKQYIQSLPTYTKFRAVNSSKPSNNTATCPPGYEFNYEVQECVPKKSKFGGVTETLPSAQNGVEQQNLKQAADWYKQWYQQRQALPQFQALAQKRLEGIGGGLPQVILKPMEELQKIGAAAEFEKAKSIYPQMDRIYASDPSTVQAYQQKLEQERGKPLEYAADLEVGVSKPVLTHEMSHWFDARFPQTMFSKKGSEKYPTGNYLELGKKSPLPRDEQMWISSRMVVGNTPLRTEVNAVLNNLRQAEGLRGDQPTTPEQMQKIIEKYRNLPKDKLAPQTKEGSINTIIRTLIESVGGDPEKLSELNNRIVAAQQEGTPMAQNGMEMKYYQEGLDWKPKTISKNGGWLDKFDDGGVVKDDMGYWNPANRGKVVEISSPYITMKGVDQPLIGVSDTGDIQYMEPGNDYEFDGTSVREYPVAAQGVSVNKADEYPLEKLDNLLNFTNYNKPKAKNGWLEKYK